MMPFSNGRGNVVGKKANICSDCAHEKDSCYTHCYSDYDFFEPKSKPLKQTTIKHYNVGDDVFFMLPDASVKKGKIYDFIDNSDCYRIQSENNYYTVNAFDMIFCDSDFVGKKDDAGKLRYGLVPVRALEEVVRGLMDGVKNYGEGENWKRVENFKVRYVDANMRHMEKYRSGEMIDPKSGVHHLAHQICNALFLIEKDLSND